ncbi:membrane-associated, eicosanoid/glutathione metabolism protein [Clohesyomyces aquaticus]|uniref:Membrane-associated, eicosanoid/glutathione metabolism protein n=1 Tax=Clohesyomyces aquaticus TaxID=1231657 RepID=A0A1Y1ZRS7_9PLEO|nr:membrane-associated, eicosanoid/glutathione metabolism protein [Clohesyomyces aquaticus]
MATKIGLGVPLPMLAPATATWAAPFAAYYVFLQNRVVYQRLSNKCYLGDNSEKGNKDPLYICNRAQLNFIENVPLALIVAFLAELNGANRKYINWGLGALFAFRVSHAELGMVMAKGFGYGRAVGYYGTEVVVAGFAGYLAYLVKGY